MAARESAFEDLCIDVSFMTGEARKVLLRIRQRVHAHYGPALPSKARRNQIDSLSALNKIVNALREIPDPLHGYIESSKFAGLPVSSYGPRAWRATPKMLLLYRSMTLGAALEKAPPETGDVRVLQWLLERRIEHLKGHASRDFIRRAGLVGISGRREFKRNVELAFRSEGAPSAEAIRAQVLKEPVARMLRAHGGVLGPRFDVVVGILYLSLVGFYPRPTRRLASGRPEGGSAVFPAALMRDIADLLNKQFGQLYGDVSTTRVISGIQAVIKALKKQYPGADPIQRFRTPAPIPADPRRIPGSARMRSRTANNI